MLQRIPSCSRTRAASIPSQVAAILMRTRSRGAPARSYSEISLRALAAVASASLDRRASTSVDTRPGTIARIRVPKSTARRSIATRTTRFGDAEAPASGRAQRRASSTSSAYSARWAADVRRDALVVASSGLSVSIDCRSPVSATTTLMAESCSRRYLRMAPHVVDQRVGGRVVRGHRARRRQLRLDPPGELLAELDPELIEAVHLPDHALHEDPVLVDRDQAPERLRVEAAVDDRGRRPISLEAAPRITGRRVLAEHERLGLGQEVGQQDAVVVAERVLGLDGRQEVARDQVGP